MIGKPKPPGWMFQKHVYFFLFCGFSTRNVFGQVSVQIFGFKCPIHRQTKGYHGNLVIITIINLFFWVFLFLTSNAFTTVYRFIRHFEKGYYYVCFPLKLALSTAGLFLCTKLATWTTTHIHFTSPYGKANNGTLLYLQLLSFNFCYTTFCKLLLYSVIGLYC